MTDDLTSRLVTRVGDVEVWQVPELVLPTSVRWLLPDAERAAVDAAKEWLQPHFMDANGYLLQSIHTYLLKTPDAVVLIDTGVGNQKRRGGGIPAFDMLDTPFLERLRAAGVSREDVDLVLCTHMHTDHVGWDAYLDGDEWRPTFPRARHLFARPEYDHFAATTQAAAPTQQLWQDSIEPVVKAGLVDVVEPDYQVAPGIRLEPSFGHTPGHVSVKVESAGQSAVFTGDAMHSPLQAALPHLRCALGGPEEPARHARLEILQRYAGTETLLFGAHFAFPCGGRLRREGDAFRIDALS
ncbi:MAG TPA: MBL fold metallo-hydrolase [Dehalococcoidia bacterium]|nr:MBL fold metallo-hydrolase [Dehalococcoidia bacterium]